MAKSFYNIISSGKLEVNHKGNDVELELPSWLKEVNGKLEDEQALLAWAQEYEVLHGLMHFGIQQVIIALRSAARPQVKIFRDVEKAKAFMAGIEDIDNWHVSKGQDEFSKNILVDSKEAQKRVDGFVLKMVPKPGESKAGATIKAEKNVLIKTIAAMQVAGQDDTVIMTILEPAFGKEKVTLALNDLKKNNN
jgi:hypothetical protein